MIVRPYDDAAPESEPPPAPPDAVLVYTPFRVVKLGHSQELRIDLGEKGHRLSVSCRLWKSKGRGRPMVPERPLHVFPEHLPELIAALTEAAAALAADRASSAL